MGRLGTGKLGNSKLGSADAAEIPADDVRERYDSLIKSAFPHEKDSGTNWDQLLWTLAYEPARLHETIGDIRTAHDVTEASLAQLDKLGAQFLVSRQTDESDAHLRRRIQAQWPKYTTRATIDELVETAAHVLECEPNDIEVRELTSVEPARVDLYVNPVVMAAAPITEADFVGLMEEVRAAGVELSATTGDLFTYRALGDANDSSKAYDIAPYADLISARHDGGPVFGGFSPGGYGDGGFGEGGYGSGATSAGD